MSLSSGGRPSLEVEELWKVALGLERLWHFSNIIGCVEETEMLKKAWCEQPTRVQEEKKSDCRTSALE